MFLELCVVLVGLILLQIYNLYRKLLNGFTYWETKNVPYIKARPLLEQLGIKRNRSLTDHVKIWYNAHPNARYIGGYFFTDPTLLIRDPDLIKEITIKSFDHFVDHRAYVHESVDVLWSKSLFATTGENWRNLRPILSPTFTGSKMRYLFPILEECSKDFIRFFDDQDKNSIELELKDTFGKYTIDVIASAAFGLKMNSLKNPENEFYINGLKVAHLFDNWRFVLHTMFPTIGKLAKVTLFSPSVYKFFIPIITNTIRKRKEENIVRPDFLQLLIQASDDNKVDEENDDEKPKQTTKPTKHVPLNIEDVCAQAVIFLLGGFDTISTGLSFVAYELAVNQDVQERLYEEIKNVLEEDSGGLSYERLHKLKYLDMVVSESLRKWSPFPAVDRLVTKKFVIEPKLPGEPTVVLKPGDTVWLPFCGIHMDPKYFPNPEKFDPERFSDENKDKIVPFSYMPFGNGPRNCIGSRFALLEIKLLVFYLILNFQITPTERSQIPPVINPTSPALVAQSLYFAFNRRNKTK